jgi:hypothetical protein
MTDLSGRIIHTFFSENKAEGIHQEKLNLHRLSQGIYILQFKTPGGIKSTKLIKE